MSILSYENETLFTCKLNSFYINGCVPGPALIERLRSTRRWAIDQNDVEAFLICSNEGLTLEILASQTRYGG